MTNNTINQIEAVSNSFELFNLINEHRVLAGEKPYRNHTDLMVKVKKECKDFCAHENVCPIKYTSGKGKEDSFNAYILTRKQVFKTAMRESSDVRDSVYDYIVALEEKSRLLQGMVWETIRGQKYISQMQALKCAGVNNPIIFMNMLKDNAKWLGNVMKRDLLVNITVNEHKDRAYKFTQKGFEWLIDNNSRINEMTKKK